VNSVKCFLRSQQRPNKRVAEFSDYEVPDYSKVHSFVSVFIIKVKFDLLHSNFLLITCRSHFKIHSDIKSFRV